MHVDSNNEVEADFEDEKLVKDKNQPNGNAVKKEKEGKFHLERSYCT